MSEPLTFEDAAELLGAMQVEYGQAFEYRGEPGAGRKKFDLPLFTGIQTPFTSQDWTDTCMREGPLYLGGCCATMSAVQDYMNEVFRDGGWMPVETLADIAQLLEGHGGWPDGAPYERLQTVWKAVEKFWAPRRDTASAKITDKDGEEALYDALRVCNKAFWSLEMEMLFDWFSDRTEDSSAKKHPRPTYKIAGRAALLSGFLPALRVLQAHIDKADWGPVENAFAVTASDNKEVVRNRLGYCIYETQKEAEEMLQLFQKDDEQYQEKRNVKAASLFVVRRCRVSKEHGIQILED